MWIVLTKSNSGETFAYYGFKTKSDAAAFATDNLTGYACEIIRAIKIG